MSSRAYKAAEATVMPVAKPGKSSRPVLGTKFRSLMSGVNADQVWQWDNHIRFLLF